MVPDKDVFGIVRFWDRDTGRVRLSKYGSKSISDIVLLKSGDRFAWGTARCRVRIHDVCEGRRITVLRGEQASASPISLALDGEMLLVAYYRSVRAWMTANWSRVGSFPIKSVTAMSSANGSPFFAAGTHEGGIEVWSLVPFKRLAKFTAHTGRIRCVVLSPDDQTLLSCSEDGMVKTWEATTGRMINSFELPAGNHSSPSAAKARVHAAIFIPGTGLLGPGDDWGSVRVWDPASGVVLSQAQPPSYVTALAVTQDGHTLATGHGNGRVRLWALEL
jgi:WD40 repeat protein